MTLQDEIQKISLAFKKKQELEEKIKELIHQYEDETGLKITGIRFNRLETIRSHSSHYTEICLNIL